MSKSQKGISSQDDDQSSQPIRDRHSTQSKTKLTSQHNRILNPKNQIITLITQRQQACNIYIDFFKEVKSTICANSLQNSQHFNQQLYYSQQFDKDDFFLSQNQLQNCLIKQLQANQFIVAKTSYSQQARKDNPKLNLNFKILRSIPSYQIIQLFCQLGKFSKRFTVLNNFNKNQIHNKKNLPFHNIFPQNQKIQGSYSKASSFQFLDQLYFLKCIPLEGSNKLPFLQILKQIFIAFMMSALEIGPRIKRLNGFDFVVNCDCVQFFMDYCQYPGKLTKKDEYDLKLSLLKMHALKICHMDIKPHNIMYCTKYKKMILIDFGLSEMLQKVVGQKTYTQFSGTSAFASPEMNRLIGDSRGWVDLYLNDKSGLQITLNQLKQKSPSQDKNLKFQSYEFNCKYTLIQKKSQTKKQIFQQFITKVSKTFKLINQLSEVTDLQTSKKQIAMLKDYQQLDYFILLRVLIQSIKFLNYSWKIWFFQNYYGGSMNAQQFKFFFQKLYNLDSISVQIINFDKLLNKEFLNQVQKYPLSQNNLTFFQTFFFDKNITHQIKRFYHTQSKLAQKNNQNICNSSFKNNSQQYTQILKQTHSMQSLNIMLDQQKIKSKYFQNASNLVDFIDFFIEHLKLANSKRIQPNQKFKFIQIINSVSYKNFINNFFDHLKQSSYFIKYLLGIQDENTKRDDKWFPIMQIVLEVSFINHQKRQFQPVVDVYRRFLTLLLSYEYRLQFKQNFQNKQGISLPIKGRIIDRAVIELLKLHLPDIIKSAIFLGIILFKQIKPLLTILVRHIISEQNLRNYLVLVCVKQFLEISFIIENQYIFIQKNQVQKLHYKLFRSDWFNQNLFKEIKNTLDQWMINSVKIEKSDHIIKKLQILTKLWIFFNHDVVSYTKTSTDLLEIFSAILNALNNQFQQLNSIMQFQFYSLYKQVAESIRDYSLIKYLGVMDPIWRHSSTIQGTETSYKKLWQFNKDRIFSQFKSYSFSFTEYKEGDQVSKQKCSDVNQKNPNQQFLEDSDFRSFEKPPSLNYYILSEPQYYSFQVQPARRKLSLNSLLPIDINLIAIQLTYYFHLPIRAEFMLNLNDQIQFQSVLLLVLNQNIVNTFHIKTILKFVDLLADFIIKNIRNMTIDIKKILFMLWKQLIEILKQITQKSNNQLTLLQKEYFNLTYVQILQKLLILLTTLLSDPINNRQEVNKFQVLSNFDQVANILSSYQSQNQHNTKIKIYNKYFLLKSKLKINKKYPQIKFFKKTQYLQTLIKILQGFIYLKDCNKQLEQAPIKQSMSEQLWGTMLQTIFVQILPLVSPHKIQQIYMVKNISKKDQLSRIQQSLNFRGMISFLQNSLINNISNLPQFYRIWFNFLQFFDSLQRNNFTEEYFEFQQKNKLREQTFPIFLLFTSLVQQNMVQDILKQLVDRLRYKTKTYLNELTYILILFQQRAFHLSENIQEVIDKLKTLRVICGVLERNNISLRIKRYLQQFYLNFILLNTRILQLGKVPEDKSFLVSKIKKKVKKSSNLYSETRKLIKQIEQQSFFQRKPIYYLIQEYLLIGCQINDSQKIDNSVVQQVKTKHYQKRLRYFLIAIDDKDRKQKLNKNRQYNLRILRLRCAKFFQGMNNNSLRGMVDQLKQMIQNRKGNIEQSSFGMKVQAITNKNKQKSRNYQQKDYDSQFHTDRMSEQAIGGKYISVNSQIQLSSQNQQQQNQQKGRQQQQQQQTPLNQKLSQLVGQFRYHFQIPAQKKKLYIQKFVAYILSPNLSL